MTDPLLFEDLDTVPRRHLFTLFGVPWNATPTAWMGQVIFFAVSIVVALAFGQSILTGIAFWIVLELSYFFHDVGHVLGGKAVGSPMDEALITTIRHVNYYRGVQDFPKQVHLGRALGGPLLNATVGLIMLTLWQSTDSPVFLFAVFINLGVFGLASLLPLPSIDGEIIWRELRR